MKKIIGLLIVLIGIALPTYAQPEDATVETIDGKKYYVHIVQQGNTLYGIHQLYNTSVESILAENEGLSTDLNVGQLIIIPIKVTENKHYGKHTVKEGETLYGISKTYKCSVDDLKTLNPDLTDGISPGQELFVPKAGIDGGAERIGEVLQSDPVVQEADKTEQTFEVSYKDSIVEHTVLPHETLYSIAKRYMVSSDTIMALNGLRNTRIKKGDVLKIPVKNVNYEVIEKDLTELVVEDTLAPVYKETEFKESYNVALFLPLMLSKNDREMSKPLKLDEVREMYGTTKISFDFYQGFLLAADSLSNAGLSVDIYVYDTNRDTATIGKIFKKPEFETMDLVIGPLYPRTIPYTAKLCAEKQIRIVLPFNSDAEILYENPYAYKGVASNMTLLDGTIDYIIENHKNHNIIILKPKTALDIALYERARARFNEKIKRESGTYNISVIETPGSSSGRTLNALINKDTTNVFIIPSTNLTLVSNAMSNLNQMLNMNPYSKKLRVIAFGLEEWNKFTDLDVKYRNRSNQHYASYRFLDYDSEQGVKFIHAFRNRFGTDPNVYSSQGFDYGMYFLSALHLYGTNFDLSIAQHQMKLTQNDFQFRTVENGSGRENQRVCIVKYDNYKLVQLK